MRKLASVFVFVSFCACMAHAQIFSAPEVHAGGGWTSTVGAMNSGYDGNGHFVLGAGVGVLPLLELQAEYMRNYFGIRASRAASNGFTSGSATIDSVTLDPLIHIGVPTSRFGAYATGGLGFYHLSNNYTGPTQSFTHNRLGVNIGGGVTYKIFGPAKLYGEVRYHHSGVDISMVPVTVGIRF